ncbi:MAG: hypothetical protein IPP90_01840 [Gemmatimonadaceae bacterium]|nr:hypothetical protein [Gemmatimonadaceae bacterium]
MSETGTAPVSETTPEPVPEPIAAPDRARSRFDAALATGSLTAISTGGALIGLGFRDDDAGRVFRLAGRGVLGRLGIASATVPLTAVGVGYLHHLLVATLWGLGLALVVLSFRGVTRIAAAIIAAALYAWLSVDFVPAALRIGYSVTSTIPNAVSVGVSLAVALLGGVWLSATDTQG